MDLFQGKGFEHGSIVHETAPPFPPFLQLLAEVERMARGFGVSEDIAYTCETASHFWLLHILSRWEEGRSVISRPVPSGWQG